MLRAVPVADAPVAAGLRRHQRVHERDLPGTGVLGM